MNAPNIVEAVVAVTTHGEILLSPDRKPMTFRLPAGMTLTKVSMAVPGVCNITANRDLEVIINRIIELWRAPRNRNDWRVQAVRDVIAEFQKSTKKQVQTDRIPGNIDHAAFVHYVLKMGTETTYNPGDEVINKMFSRSAAEDKARYDYKVLALNLPNYPDLMANLLGRRGAGEILLMDVVQILQQRGINNITMFDFSCSIMDSAERDTRIIRRELTVKGLKGGKSRRYKKKTKTRRTRKARL